MARQLTECGGFPCLRCERVGKDNIQYDIDRIGLKLNPSGYFRPSERALISRELSKKGWSHIEIEQAWIHYDR